MKIALYHNLTSGGSKREAYEFSRRMVKDHTLHVYSPSTADENFLPLHQIAHQTFTFPLTLSKPLTLRLPALRKYLDLINLFRDMHKLQTLAKQVARQMHSQGYDFVFLHHDKLIQSPYLPAYLHIPTFYYCNEPMRQFYDPPIIQTKRLPRRKISDQIQQAWYKPAKNIADSVIKKQDWQNAQKATHLLANSYFSAESIWRAYHRPSQVVYLGVDTEKFRPLNLPRQNYLLSVGAISPMKSYDFLIESVAHLPESGRPPLVILGNTVSQSEANYLRSLAQTKGVELRIHENVTEDELVRFYNEAAAFIYAPMLEPFGLTPLEAMACGTPVIAIKEGGPRESVLDGQTGLLAERDPEAFAHAIAKVLNDKTLAHQLGEHGHQQVLDFWTWEHAYQRLMKAVINKFTEPQIGG